MLRNATEQNGRLVHPACAADTSVAVVAHTSSSPPLLLADNKSGTTEPNESTIFDP